MSWKAGLSRHLPILRFFACEESPSSRGILSWYKKNYEHLKILNPTLPLLLRTQENTMPAITTELDFTTTDLLKYMLQTNKFQNEDGSPNTERIQAAKAYLQFDWKTYRKERWSSPGFDPDHPFLEEKNPDWRRDATIANDLRVYISMKDQKELLEETFKSGPNEEYTRAENALLMCQRVDLWCAGEEEVEMAVKHLFMLGRRFNNVEKEMPEYITEFYPGVEDL